MFKLRIAEYINANMQERKWTYRDLSLKSGVADSSIHSYAQGRVTTPNEDNLIRIAAAFGDSPDVIQEMRREALGSTVQENKILAEAADKERMERFIILMRENMLQVMEEYRAASAAQQTEMIQHADARVEAERRRFKERAEEVARQCKEELERGEKHNKELLDVKEQMIGKIEDERTKVRNYLRTIIRNLSIALIGVSIFSVLLLSVLGGYAFYAYQTFDRADPSRGLYRAEVTPEPIEIPLE